MNINDLLVELDRRDTLLANDAASTIRELLREVEKHTTPVTGITAAHTVVEIMTLADKYADKSQAEIHYRLTGNTPSYREAVASRVESRAALLAAIERMASDRDYLLAEMQELACLGNGSEPGNSIGNCIARAAIQKVSHDTN